ncbi:MAG TPA: FAD-dependent oxidoreductase, partial [Parafilimonas sp.]|nr:FAD-dependent oxidoreductase [Parafilimonas sp.]
MQKNLSFKLLPSQASDNKTIQQHIAFALAINELSVTGFYINKKSYDARSKQVMINLSVTAFINEPFDKRTVKPVLFKDVANSKHIILIIGAGPAGLFAALKLIENGIKPVILERGKDVRSRRRDLAVLNKEGIINSESNYCFGEGGAGTYSDGKLYTRSNKRGSVDRILNLFVQFGADEKILYESHPHIGTNKLPHIITAMRKQIEDCGGEFLFEKKVIDFKIDENKISAVITADQNSFKADDIILATGHSARDIFILLNEKKILIEQKPFALGVRVEHPQSLIDAIRYHCNTR